MSIIEAPSPIVPPPAKSWPTRREVLHRAADLLEEFGWCQNTYGYCGDEIIEEPGDIRRADRMCMAGALIRADADLTGNEPNDDCSSYMRAIYDTLVGSDVLISDWNDAPGRTRAEVVARLRKAAGEEA